MSFRSWIPMVAGLPFVAALSACVTGGGQTSQAGADPVAGRPATSEEAAENDPAVLGTLADAAPDTIDWQRVLIADVDAIEEHGNVFLDSSFVLYNSLLTLGETDTAGGGAQVDTAALQKAVHTSAASYTRLVDAVARLKVDLARPEVREALPLKGDSGLQELEHIVDLFSHYGYRPDPKAVGYDAMGGDSVMKVLFSQVDSEREELLAELPKAQRDALLLLDHLKRVSSDLAQVTSTVTAWIHDVTPIDVEETFVH